MQLKFKMDALKTTKEENVGKSNLVPGGRVHGLGGLRRRLRESLDLVLGRLVPNLVGGNSKAAA